MKPVLVMFSIFMTILSPAYAVERMEFYNGIRGLGMGGSYVATVNDETALILNPAALGKLREQYITLIDPEVSIGQDTQQMVGYDPTAALSPQTVLDKLNDAPSGKYFHQGLKIFPSLVFPNFGIGFYANIESNGILINSGADVRLDYVEDYAAVIGYNFRIWDGIIKLGFNAKINNHTEIHDEFVSSSTNIALNSDAQEGVGVSSDVGLIITAPWVALPTIAAVVHDAGGTVYDLQDGFMHGTSNRPETRKQTVDAGFAISPIMGKKNRMVFTAEMRDVMNAYEDIPSTSKIHGGVEFNFGDIFFLRGGMNQGYWTTGLELAIMNYQIQAAYYGEEVGDDTAKKEDRRFVFKFAWRF